MLFMLVSLFALRGAKFAPTYVSIVTLEGELGGSGPD